MYGIVKQRDATAKNAAEHFGDDETEREYHGPAENGRLQRGVSMACMRVRMAGVVGVVRMSVLMCMIGAVAVRVRRHVPILRAQAAPTQPSDSLIRQFDTAFARMD